MQASCCASLAPLILALPTLLAWQAFPRPAPHAGASAAVTPQRQPCDDQVVYELRALGGASPALLGQREQGGVGASPAPTAGMGGAGSAKRSLGGDALALGGGTGLPEAGCGVDAELDAAGSTDPDDSFDGLGYGAPGEAGAGPAVFLGLGAAVGGLGAGAAGAGTAGASAGGAGGFSTAGLQHLAAKLRNGSLSPGDRPLQPAGGSGRYASYEGSVESKQTAGYSAGPSSAVPASGGASGSGRSRVPPLHLSRVSVADLLQGGGSGEPGPSGSAGAQGQLQAVPREMQASISRLAQSMHGSGMAAITPADIRAALLGGACTARSHSCWGKPLLAALVLWQGCLPLATCASTCCLTSPHVQGEARVCQPTRCIALPAAKRQWKALAPLQLMHGWREWHKTWRLPVCLLRQRSAHGRRRRQREVTTPTLARLPGRRAARPPAPQRPPSMRH